MNASLRSRLSGDHRQHDERGHDERGHDERGQSSLVEITLTLLILGLVLVFLFSSVESAERSVAATRLRITNLDEARTLMAVLTKDIRTATRLTAGTPPFVAATDRELTFYANLDNATGGPSQVRIYIDATSEIIASVIAADAASVAPNYTYTGSARPRYVGRYLVNSVTQPLFEYFDGAGTQLTAPLSSADLLAVASVKITLIVRSTSTLAHANITLVDQVRLPNVEYQSTG